ncbi:MAG: hypothetical protein FWC72_01095 [Oscillospiraceae bacterium]|nr:hypothetical protein [Oscillospiraceae bacterium]
MKLWNVFKMELYKNIHGRVNWILMLSLMLINTIGGFVISNQNWMRVPSTAGIMMTILFIFSVIGTFIFLFLYPYQMARVDYRNNVMSLLIASGVSRVQYYFVKVGATLLFSLLSIVLLVILPLLIVLIIHDMRLVFEFFHFNFEIDIMAIGIILLGWLSTFSMLMTAVIIVKGKRVSIFIFLGFSIVLSQIAFVIRTLIMFSAGFGNNWWEVNNTITLLQHLLTMVVMGLIGILVLRKQNL